jgi:hypothetical protein
MIRFVFIPLALVGSLLLASCNQDELARLRQENASARRDKEAIEVKVKSLEQEVARLNETRAKVKNLEQEVARLNETEANIYAHAIEALREADDSAGDNEQGIKRYETAIDLLVRFVERFPHSQNIGEAKKATERGKKSMGALGRLSGATAEFKEALSSNDFAAAEASVKRIGTLGKAELAKKLDKELFEAKNRPIEISVRDLLAEAVRYIGKRVTVGPLLVVNNNIKRASFGTHPYTGSGTRGYDGDVRLEVRYKGADELGAWRHLEGDGHTVISATGVFRPFSDDMFSGYVDAMTIHQMEK